MHNIPEKFQSGFKMGHSTETAPLRVFNELLLISDAGDSAILIILDSSTAFGIVDRDFV